MLAVHGRHHLSEQEYAQCLAQAEHLYFSRLATMVGIFRKPDPRFWEFHKKALGTANYGLNWNTLYKRLPRAILEKSWAKFTSIWKN
jgi:hypothetical protein